MKMGPPDYEVGYRKPPKKSQFTKGQSGNPRGRPKGAKNKSSDLRSALNPFHDVLGEAFVKPFTVLSAGKRHQKPALQCILDKMLVEAAGGNFKAQKLSVELAKIWGSQIQKEKTEKIGLSEAYIEHWSPIFDAAAKRGSSEPSQLPHPAHLHFLPEEFDVELRGPLNAYDKGKWDLLKEQLRSINDSIEHARRQLGTSRETPALLAKSSQLQELLRLTEAKVPEGWNWRECVTDVDRAHYQRGAGEKDDRPGKKRN